jgi:hypothetical protein
MKCSRRDSDRRKGPQDLHSLHAFNLFVSFVFTAFTIRARARNPRPDNNVVSSE